ncbi:YkoF family thiamine/hydroxymethylpyrimidine-binding protein [Formosa sp. S-31]|uniref:YkoF family thiamine/hydroxymethylpyrimidine-binding protein n=1 Tax=Formosa sp. S-31 TaxID=2790949 RepID=UPI003EBBAE48
MKISVELTLTPLQDDFETPIKEFIKELRASEFTVLENPLSTQVYGEYAEVMPFLTALIQATFKQLDHVLVNMKLVKSDRSTYEPDF